MKRARRALDGDIRARIERETQDNLDRGMTSEEARRQAMLNFGNEALIGEATRAIWHWRWLEQLAEDSRRADALFELYWRCAKGRVQSAERAVPTRNGAPVYEPSFSPTRADSGP